MNWINKLNDFTVSVLAKFKVFFVKTLLKEKLVIGRNIQLKNTSKINVWDKQGKISIGNDFSMGYNSELYSWNDKLSIGSGTSINDNCKIYGTVSIGSNCLFASNIYVSSGTHTFLHNIYLPIKSQDKLSSVVKPVVIEDDCWLGFGVVIMPGVYVGKGAIIGSNAVVTKDVFPYTINAGIPSRVIGSRLDFTNSHTKINCSTAEHWPFFYKGINYKQFDNLDSVKAGIEIFENTAVFLLQKSGSINIKIEGFTEIDREIEVYLNNAYCDIAQVSSGAFKTYLHLSKDVSTSLEDFDSLSELLKKTFDVLTIKSINLPNVRTTISPKWRIFSIGSDES